MAHRQGELDYGAIIATSRAAQALPDVVDFGPLQDALKHAAGRALASREGNDDVRRRSIRSAA